MCSFGLGKGDLEDAIDIFDDVYKKYNYKINHICTDGNPSYKANMKFYGPTYNTKHHITKSETCLVESWNSKLRYYISALVRKTKCYFKSIETAKMAMDFFMLIHNNSNKSN